LACSAQGADGGKIASGAGGKVQKFGKNTEDELRAIGHSQLAVNTFDVRMDSVRADPQSGGNDILLLIIERGAHNLKFSPRQRQAAGDPAPCNVWNEASANELEIEWRAD
jgi:hypothetical protein